MIPLVKGQLFPITYQNSTAIPLRAQVVKIRSIHSNISVVYVHAPSKSPWSEWVRSFTRYPDSLAMVCSVALRADERKWPERSWNL